MDGETIPRYRRKQEKLLAQDATFGKCGDCVPTTCTALGFICGPANDGCGDTLQCGDCNIDLTCCTGQCVNLDDDDNNYGACGFVCGVDDPDPVCCGNGARCNPWAGDGNHPARQSWLY